MVLADTKAPEALLEAAYKELDFHSGDLLNAVAYPSDGLSDPGHEHHWLDKGEWLSLAATVGAEKVFFVENNPVIVFAQEPNGDEESLRQVFNRIWCMARPRLLFLARPGELAVYNLAKQPIRRNEQAEGKRLPGIAHTASEVQSALRDYRRDQVESGRLFEDLRFEGSEYRADEALVRNLRFVRRRLVTGQPKLLSKYAHALIGRSIFVRYLEDREVLVPEYFEKIARDNNRSDWLELLQSSALRPDIEPEMENRLYLKVLTDKAFTYALFEKLSEDFNGDMFPSDEDEEKEVRQEHLLLLQRLLRGEEGNQESLFFFAYKFDVVPIELISSIYEEFYHAGTEAIDNEDTGSHYTPGALVEFVLAKTLTPERLFSNPRVMDAAAGSGIFLVEAFRRIVRYRVQQQHGQRLSREELLSILRDQISGIEINPEAARIAAFSLCLALLHYQEPRAIRGDKRLPHLLYKPSLNQLEEEKNQEQRFNILLNCDSFDVENCVTEEAVRLKFTNSCADVVVGNPPWGGPGAKDKDAQERAIAQVALNWCKRHNHHVGDRERSQAFVHRTMDLLREDGTAGLLVSTGVFFKRHSNSRKFRQEWLTSAELLNIVNFAHVRHLFFSGAVAPFASVIFRKGKPKRGHRVEYWSAKQTALVQQAQSVVLSRADMKVVSQADLLRDDTLWKVYWWGSHRDAALVGTLRLEDNLEEFTVNGQTLASDIGRGFQQIDGYSQSDSSDKNLSKYKEFPTAAFQRYGKLDTNRLKPTPKKVHRFGNVRLYEGTRLLIKRGITERSQDKGRIIARVESTPFCFRNSIHGIRFIDSVNEESIVFLGIFWSSLARYFFFMTSGSWGMWHHELHEGEIKKFPVRLPDDKYLRTRIVAIVQELREASDSGGLFAPQVAEHYKALEQQLDEVIFDLYDLNEAERDLIRDLCEVGLDLFYNNTRSRATQIVDTQHLTGANGVFEDLVQQRDARLGIEKYIFAFLDTWRGVTAPNIQLAWHVINTDPDSSMLALRFWTYQQGDTEPIVNNDTAEWSRILHYLSDSSHHLYGSRSIYIDGIARIVEESGTTIIKRNERRLWTASQAREDAEAALLQIMQMKEITA